MTPCDIEQVTWRTEFFLIRTAREPFLEMLEMIARRCHVLEIGVITSKNAADAGKAGSLSEEPAQFL